MLDVIVQLLTAAGTEINRDMYNDTDGLPTPRRYMAVAALSLGTVLAVMDGAIANVALPTIARDLGVESSSVVSIVTIYQLVLVMTLLPLSALGSRIGLRRLYRYGQAIFVVAAVLCFFARSLSFLLAVRALQALGAAAVLSVSSAMIRSIYPIGQLGRGMALNTVMASAGSALAPTLGGLVLSLAPWQWVFATSAPLGVLSLWLGRASLPTPVVRDEPYDVLGAVLCALSFGLTIFGLENTVHGGSRVMPLATIAAGLVVAVIFVRRELREKSPILPVDLLARPIIALSAIGALIMFIGSMQLLLSLPFRLQHHYGFTPGQVGAVIAPWPIAIMVVGPIAGILSDRIPAGILGGIGTAVAVPALLLLAFLPADATRIDIAWRMALCGMGFALFMPPNARLIISSVPVERVASAGGMTATIRLTGQALGATVLAMLLAMGVGDGRAPVLVAACLAVVAGICSVSRLRPALRAASA